LKPFLVSISERACNSVLESSTSRMLWMLMA
jgi:hypothetical protein